MPPTKMVAAKVSAINCGGLSLFKKDFLRRFELVANTGGVADGVAELGV